jgi:hypothetical protein
MPFPMAKFAKKIAKKDAKWRKYAKVKRVPLQPSPLKGENNGKMYLTWNPD